MIVIIATIILIYLLTKYHHSDQISLDGYKTKYFKQRSLETYEKLKEEGVSNESLVEFLVMEDRLLELEKMSVCQGISTITEITRMSQQIKTRFPGFDFSYHALYIKQAAEPGKVIDKDLRCQ